MTAAELAELKREAAHPLPAVIAFLREAFPNDGAEGESVHRLCAIAEKLPAVLTMLRTPRPVVMFAGTRDLDATGLVRKLVYELPEDAIVLHGGSGLVDLAVHRFARERGLVTGVFEANWRIHGKKGGPLRSLAAVELADRVIVIWDGQSPGSMRTRDHAKKLGRQLEEHVLARTSSPRGPLRPKVEPES